MFHAGNCYSPAVNQLVGFSVDLLFLPVHLDFLDDDVGVNSVRGCIRVVFDVKLLLLFLQLGTLLLHLGGLFFILTFFLFIVS